MIKNKKKITSKLWTVALVILCITLYLSGQNMTRKHNELQEIVDMQSVELFELQLERDQIQNKHDILEDTLSQIELQKQQ